MSPHPQFRAVAPFSQFIAVTVTPTAIPDVLLIKPTVYSDERGFFLESYRAERYAAAGISEPLVQLNHSRSRRGTLRGLHFQRRHPQGKLVRVACGEVFDVAVDVRPGSPTFGQQVSAVLSDENHHQLWIPGGIAHGFCVLSDSADFLYGVTDIYRPDDEGGIRWDDPDLGIVWPVDAPIMSQRDRTLPRLAELGPDMLPAVE
jgi:dTDP-4-dehydrorhamnose 3,5-epimerase